MFPLQQFEELKKKTTTKNKPQKDTTPQKNQKEHLMHRK